MENETLVTERKKVAAISWRRKALYILIIMIVCVLGIEGGFRLLLKLKKSDVDTYRLDYFNVLKQGPNSENYRRFYEPGLFQSNPYLPFLQRANLNHTWIYKFPFSNGPVRIDFKTNSFGLRGPEISLRRPKGTYRILCLGGSTTFGEVPSADCWPLKLENKLRAAHPDKKIEVINAGIVDYNSADSLVAFQLRWIELQPNLVIVHHLINDYVNAWYRPFYSDYSASRKDLPSEPTMIDYAPRIFEKSAVFCFLRWKLYPGRRNNIFNLVHYPPRGGYSREALDTFIRNMRSIILIARGNGMDTIITTMKYHPKVVWAKANKGTIESYGYLTKWNQALRDLAVEQNVPIVDEYNLMPEDRSNHYDGWHLSPKGEELFAGYFFDEIERQGYLNKTP